MQYTLRHYRIEPYHAPLGELVTPDFGGIAEASSFERTLPPGHLGRLLPVRRINWEQTFAFHHKSLTDYDFVERERRDEVSCFKFRSNDQSRIVGRPEELLFWHDPNLSGTVQGDVLTFACFAPSFRVSLHSALSLSEVEPSRRLKHLWWVTDIREFTQGLVSNAMPGKARKSVQLSLAELFKEPWDDTFSLLALH
jgi:hypothetical protein